MNIVSFSDNKKLLNKFMQLAWDIYKGNPYWVPPLRIEQKKLLNIHKHPFHKHGKVKYFMVEDNKKIVGRIAAVMNFRHNEYNNENVGFFGFFESINNQDVANLLFDNAIAWLKENYKVDAVRGPMNFSTNEECGLLIDAFDQPPYIMMTYNPDYYSNLIENYGFKKEKDLLAYMLDQEEIPPRLERIAKYLERKNTIIVRNVNLKKMDSEIKIIKHVYNNAWGKNWGFVPMTEDEFEALKESLIQLIDEDLLLLAFINDEPAGFYLALPNINEILINIPSGKLLPFGIFKLIFGMKKIKSFRLITLGIVDKFRRKGIDVLFYYYAIKNAIKKTGRAYGEMSWLLEDNLSIIKPIEDIGGYRNKTYRIYRKDL